jgi:TetR/AcrR family transcriptional regulator, transcriptional repressor of bet genes
MATPTLCSSRVSDRAKITRLTSEDRRAQLEEAALACMARGGILHFTIDRVCAEAGVSRGLITHHFGSKDGLLAAVYARMYRSMLASIEVPVAGEPRLVTLVEAMVSPAQFAPDTINIWLTLWGEIATNPVLRDEHRRQYATYRADVVAAIGELALLRGVAVDADTLALSLICLIDGLGLQHCIDPSVVDADQARDACYRLLEGPLGRLREPALQVSLPTKGDFP